jgi:hypothetical protein
MLHVLDRGDHIHSRYKLQGMTHVKCTHILGSIEVTVESVHYREVSVKRDLTVFLYVLHVNVLTTFSKQSNMYDRVLGIIPLSEYRSAPPVMVNVFPDPVCNNELLISPI